MFYLVLFCLTPQAFLVDTVWQWDEGLVCFAASGVLLTSSAPAQSSSSAAAAQCEWRVEGAVLRVLLGAHGVHELRLALSRREAGGVRRFDWRPVHLMLVGAVRGAAEAGNGFPHAWLARKSAELGMGAGAAADGCVIV